MKRFLVAAFCLVVASGVFAAELQVGALHAQNGYDYSDMTVTVVVSPAGTGVLWVNAAYNFQFLPAERDILVQLVQVAQKKINIAYANKSTISITREIGGFYSDTWALVTVAFVTQGYESSYTLVRIKYFGDDIVFLLDKKDTQDFITALGNARSYVADYERQVALFK
jgi:hypothetical protein